jgi:hypothetical protein
MVGGRLNQTKLQLNGDVHGLDGGKLCWCNPHKQQKSGKESQETLKPVESVVWEFG